MQYAFVIVKATELRATVFAFEPREAKVLAQESQLCIFYAEWSFTVTAEAEAVAVFEMAVTTVNMCSDCCVN